MSIKINGKSCQISFMSCSFGTMPIPFMNEILHLPFVNKNSLLPLNTVFLARQIMFLRGFGVCSATGTFCRPAILHVINSSNVFLNNSEVLTEGSEILCVFGGRIKLAA